MSSIRKVWSVATAQTDRYGDNSAFEVNADVARIDNGVLIFENFDVGGMVAAYGPAAWFSVDYVGPVDWDQETV